MPRFFLHLRNDIYPPDPEGVDLPDLTAARSKAIESARFTLAQTAINEGKINFEHSIDIEDGEGCVLDTVWFRDAVEVQG
jgi:hypothetical protein